MKIRIDLGLPIITVILHHQNKQLKVGKVVLNTGSAGSIFKMSKLAEIGLKPEPEDKVRRITGVGGSEFVYVKKTVEHNQNEFLENYQFRTLLGYGKFVSGFGWIIVVLGVIAILYGIDSIKTTGFITIVSGVFSVISGIGFVVYGQLVLCFVSIERNTRGTYEILKAQN